VREVRFPRVCHRSGLVQGAYPLGPSFCFPSLTLALSRRGTARRARSCGGRGPSWKPELSSPGLILARIEDKPHFQITQNDPRCFSALNFQLWTSSSQKNERPVGGPAARAWGMEGLAT
jgi:hypothetical protein